ncbi:MAG: ornithine cyclodeaminase family protein, partial [Acidobacteriota bacterium]|nr:ornithine cyclodeaminase family protein [Acidobacteriota bacterium]
LSESDVQETLAMGDLIPAMEGALAGFSAGRVLQPVRGVMEYGPASFFGLMPAFDPESGFVGAKVLSVKLQNLEQGLPSHTAVIPLFDAASGQLLAVMDGGYITEARTAAVSAVSARYLAREDARVLAIVGSGVQARSHLEALSLVRGFAEVRAWSPTRPRLEAFAARSGGRVRAAASAEEAVRGADVVVLATSAQRPVVEDAWIAPGAHVIAVGACRPTHHEAPPELIRRALLVVDSRAAAVVEAGDVILAAAQQRIHAELGEIVSGVKRGRATAGEVTVFKSLGLAIEDVVSADLAYRRALAAGRGVQVPL